MYSWWIWYKFFVEFLVLMGRVGEVGVVCQLVFRQIGSQHIGPRQIRPLENVGAAIWAPAKWAPLYLQYRGRICHTNIFQGSNLRGLNLPKNGKVGPKKGWAKFAAKLARGPICLEPFFRCASISWISHSCFLELVDLCQILPQAASSVSKVVNIGCQHW